MSLPAIFRKFKCRLIGATLGYQGVIVWDGTQFTLCAGFQVNARDTTGAGDILHGAFAYALLQQWPLTQILEFASAAAALNCEHPGARGGIASLQEIESLQRSAARSEPAYSPQELLEAGKQARLGAPNQSAGPHNLTADQTRSAS
jgi:sugar/nucleoside kinase (ribokinase family)